VNNLMTFYNPNVTHKNNFFNQMTAMFCVYRMVNDTQTRSAKEIPMSEIQEIQCTGWDDFKTKLRENIYSDQRFLEGQFLYRGQSNASYKLTSSFDRWYKGRRERRPTVAQELLKIFKKECESDTDVSREVLQDEENLRSLAQHYGLPTRLLDWTTSPYVAAFFAFSCTFSEDATVEDRVAVWILDPASAIWSEDNGAYVIDPQRFGNPRLQRQGGFFTHLVGAFDSLEDYALSFDETNVLRKIIIPTADIDYALSDLRAMQIKHAKLFPGPEGYAMEAKTRVGIDQKPKRSSKK
jgi:hypothetical protein